MGNCLPSPTSDRVHKVCCRTVPVRTGFLVAAWRRGDPLELRQPFFRSPLGELARVDPELLEQRRVLLVVHLFRKLVERLLQVLRLALLLQLGDHELLVEVPPGRPLIPRGGGDSIACRQLE